MSDHISIEALANVTHIYNGNDVAQVLLTAAKESGYTFQDQDVVCVASKAVSMAEGREIDLRTIEVSDVAKRIHESIPRKDLRTLQVIINETGEADGSRVELGDNYIAGWLPNGLRLTSSGVDKLDADTVILLPKDPDASAARIGQAILSSTGARVAVIITDSDGRIEKKGATQLAIGLYGVPALRTTTSESTDGKVSTAEETICDMFAAAAGLLMGQRGANKPIVIIRGLEYEFAERSSIVDSLSRPEIQ